MIEKRFTTAFTVRRQQWVIEQVGDQDIDKSEEVAVGSFLGYRQQANADYVQSLGLQITKPHIVWCGVTINVVEGDILVSEFGVDKVRSVQINRDGSNQHKELLVEFVGDPITSESS